MQCSRFLDRRCGAHSSRWPEVSISIHSPLTYISNICRIYLAFLASKALRHLKQILIETLEPPSATDTLHVFKIDFKPGGSKGIVFCILFYHSSYSARWQNKKSSVGHWQRLDELLGASTLHPTIIWDLQRKILIVRPVLRAFWNLTDLPAAAREWMLVWAISCRTRIWCALGKRVSALNAFEVCMKCWTLNQFVL